MKWVFKWHRLKQICSNDFLQQSIKDMVALSYSNASFIEVIGSGKPPPLLPSSKLDNWCSISYASIEHMILYLSFLAYIINASNKFPYNSLQIDVLYHGPPVIQPNYVCPYHILNPHDFQLSISYQNGVTLYSIQKLWLFIGNRFPINPHL